MMLLKLPNLKRSPRRRTSAPLGARRLQHGGRGRLEVDMVKEIPLTQGKVALVDDEDFDRVSVYKWFAVKTGGSKIFYATTSLPKPAPRKEKRPVRMHRFIMNPPPGMQVDHISGDTMDNRRANLRVCTQAQNKCNKAKVPGSSDFKGVCWDVERGKWKTQISVGNKNRVIGRFDFEKDAAKAYDAAAKEAYGEFARVNFPEAS